MAESTSLEVFVKSAQNIPNVDRPGGNSDPFVAITFQGGFACIWAGTTIAVACRRANGCREKEKQTNSEMQENRLPVHNN